MKPCHNCGEDVGDATICPNCGRRQYRYAVEEDVSIGSERDESLEDVAELLRERIEPPPSRPREREWSPPREWDAGSARKSEQPPPQIQGTSTRSGVGCLLTFLILGFGAFWLLLVVGVATDSSAEVGPSILGGVIMSLIPALIILSLFRRWRRGR